MSTRWHSLDRRRRALVLTAVCLVVSAAFPLVAFRDVVFGSATIDTSTLAGITSVNGFDSVQDSPPRIASAWRPDAGASAWQMEPWSKAVSRAYRDGTWPLWNPYQGAGKPLAANMQAGAFDPMLAGVFVRPTPGMRDLALVGALCLGSVATFLFLRSLRTRRVAALAGAAVFSFGGYWAVSANNSFARTYVYLPIVLFLVNKALDAGIGPWTFALGLALAGTVLVGMPESAFFVLGAAALYAIYCALTRAPDRRLPALGNLAIAGGLGVAIASPLLVLFAQYEPLSFNTHKGHSVVGTKADPTQALITWFAPYFNGSPRGAWVFNEVYARAWVGGAALALACLCAAASTRFLRARRVLPLAVALVPLFWKMYGLPGATALGRLPVFRQINWPSFGAAVGMVLLAFMTGLGLDAILRRQLRPQRLAITAGVFALVAIALVAGNPAIIAASGFAHAARQVVPALVGAAAVFAIAWFATSRDRRRIGGAVVLGIVIVQLVTLFPHGTYAARVEPFADQPWFSLIEPARATSAAREPVRVFGLDTKLFPETASATGFYDIRMLDALFVDRYFDYIHTFVDGGIKDRYAGAPHFSKETGTQYVDNPMFDLLGVRYILSGAAAPGTIYDELAHQLAGRDDDGIATGVVRVDGERQPAVVATSGSQATVAVPDQAVAVRGRVANLSRANMTFDVVGVRADGSETRVARVVIPSGGRDATSEPLAATLPPGVYSRVTFRTTSPDARAEGAWLRLEFADAAGNPMSSQYQFIGSAYGTSVWENLDRMPRAFVVHDVEHAQSRADARRRLKRGSTKVPGGAYRVGAFDPRRTAVVETDEPIETKECATPATVSFERYRAQAVRMVVDSPCPGLLVLSDTYYPGWKATVDGADADIFPTDLAFRGVAVPAGRSVVVMEYAPKGFRIALAVAIAAFVAGLLILIVVPLRRHLASRGPGAAPQPHGESLGGYPRGP